MIDAELPTVASLDDAVEQWRDRNVAVISVPGEHAAAEARHALELGLHAFVLSSGMSIDDEVSLKRLAAERDLLCMGPDCGTSIIAGSGLGFSNVVARGPVGVVGPSGSGLQAVACLLDRHRIGVSHLIGAGSRDMNDAVGGATTLAALRALDDDPRTSLIVVVAEPPQPAAAAAVRALAGALRTPTLLCFLGAPGGHGSLDDLVRAIAFALGRTIDRPMVDRHAAAVATGKLRPEQRRLLGLYCRGTLAYEAQLVLRQVGLPVRSNIPLPGGELAGDPIDASTVLDVGAEQDARGRAHPVIDPRTRLAHLAAAAEDPGLGVILLDVVLGHGAAADPAGDLADGIRASIATAEAAGRGLCVIASVCGTEADPQVRSRQEATLRGAGAHVLPTNALACRFAGAVLEEPA